MKRLIVPLVAVLVLTCGFVWPFHFFSTPNAELFGTDAWINKEVQILTESSTINPTALRYSLIAYTKARAEGLDNKQILTVIDFSQPSTAKRLWIFDLRTGRMLMNTWVAHGKNSGDVNTTSFSNNNSSLKTSIGVYVTNDIYVGHHGNSLRVTGLEPGFNDHAYTRAIVFHGAPYVNTDSIKQRGRIGRSWGCFAVNPNLISSVVKNIKNNTIVVAYYPDKRWLSQSHYLSA